MSENLNTFIEKIKFDTRMVDYNIKQGAITSTEYEQYLAQLPDLADKTVSLELDEPTTVNEDETQSPTIEDSQVADPFNPEGQTPY